MEEEVRTMLITQAKEHIGLCQMALEEFVVAEDALRVAGIEYGHYGYIAERPEFVIDKKDLGRIRNIFGRLRVDGREAAWNEPNCAVVRLGLEDNRSLSRVTFRYLEPLDPDDPCRVVMQTVEVPTLVCNVKQEA